MASLSLVVAAGLLLQTTDRTRSAFLWVSQNERVIREVDELIGDIREAESGQRGFLLTRSAAYLDTFNERIVSAEQRGGELAHLTEGALDQTDRVKGLRSVIAAKIESLKVPLGMAEAGRFDEAIEFVSNGRGRSLMDELARRADGIKASEESLLKLRMDEAERQGEWNHLLLLFGGPAGALLFFGIIHLLVASFRRPMQNLMDAIVALGSGTLDQRAGIHSGLSEIDRLAVAYNDMADRLKSAIERLAASDEQLQAVNAELRERGRAVEVLGGMAHRMQAAHSDDELAEVLNCFLPLILPNAPGALYAYTDKRNLLVRIASWGMAEGLLESFRPDDCWALRRGRSHCVSTEGADICCRHVSAIDGGYHCEPVLAAGETVGLLYLDGAISVDDRFRLSALGETIALALVNQRLQRDLKARSVRDPLTGLFNRRHMEEVLSTEIDRAGRSGQSLGVIMCDIDHFKRFNDQFGHEAGDTVLQEIAAAIGRGFTDAETVCRYGGEEFAVIVPCANVARLVASAEELRQTIAQMAIGYRGLKLGPATMSFGVALWNGEGGAGGLDLLRRADAALYRAKSAGRDRTVVEEDSLRLVSAA